MVRGGKPADMKSRGRSGRFIELEEEKILDTGGQIITGSSDSWFEPQFPSLHSTVHGRLILPGPSLHALSLSHPAASLALLVPSPPLHCPGHADILFLKHPRNVSSLGSLPALFFVPVLSCPQLPAHLLSLGADLTLVFPLSSPICFLSVDHILPT